MKNRSFFTVKLPLSVAALALLSGAVHAETTGCPSPKSFGKNKELAEFVQRGDIAPLPGPLCDRLVELTARPKSLPVLPVFNEDDETSQLFGYYLLDTEEFERNVFTAPFKGINDKALPTGANAANGGMPSIGAIRMIYEPKSGLPGDPKSADDPAAFVDVFTDISGLFVINNEAGWYEGWVIRDMTVPKTVAELDSQGINPWGTMTSADYRALRAKSIKGVNLPGSIFAADGKAVRLPSPEDDIANHDIGNTVGFPVSIGAFNTLQQSDGHAYWEFNPGTNWVFPLYELPFTGDLGVTSALVTPSTITPSAESFYSGNLREAVKGPRAEALADHPLNPRDPDRFEDSVGLTQAETRNRFIPSALANEILLDVFIRTESFEPGVGLPDRLYHSYVKQVAKFDTNGDGAISFGEAHVTANLKNGDESITGRDLFIPATEWPRYAITRELNDGLLAPRFAPTQAAYVLSGLFERVEPAIKTAVGRDADDR
jgi:hypothetical protein